MKAPAKNLATTLARKLGAEKFIFKHNDEYVLYGYVGAHMDHNDVYVDSLNDAKTKHLRRCLVQKDVSIVIGGKNGTSTAYFAQKEMAKKTEKGKYV